MSPTLQRVHQDPDQAGDGATFTKIPAQVPGDDAPTGSEEGLNVLYDCSLHKYTPPSQLKSHWDSSTPSFRPVLASFAPHVVVLDRRYLSADSGKNCDSHFFLTPLLEV